MTREVIKGILLELLRDHNIDVDDPEYFHEIVDEAVWDLQQLAGSDD